MQKAIKILSVIGICLNAAGILLSNISGFAGASSSVSASLHDFLLTFVGMNIMPFNSLAINIITAVYLLKKADVIQNIVGEIILLALKFSPWLLLVSLFISRLWQQILSQSGVASLQFYSIYSSYYSLIPLTGYANIVLIVASAFSIAQKLLQRQKQI